MSTFRVTVDGGTNLHVKILDADPSIKKPLLITLHGAPGLSDHTEPENSFGFLQSQFRVLVYDARGSGISDLKGPYTNEQWVKDADALREWAGEEKIVLAGGSYGGFLALTYALTFPNRVLGLILRNTFAWGSRGMMNALKQCLTSPRLKVDPERQLRLWSGYIRDDQDFQDGYEEIIPLYAPDVDKNETADNSSLLFEGVKKSAKGKNFHAETHNAAFGFNVPRYDVRDRLKDITCPTLVVVGRYDLVAPVENSMEIHEGIPNSELAIFERSGHSPPSDEPEAFQARVREFLSSLRL